MKKMLNSSLWFIYRRFTRNAGTGTVQFIWKLCELNANLRGFHEECRESRQRSSNTFSRNLFWLYNHKKINYELFSDYRFFFSGLMTVFALSFLTPYFEFIPKAVLSAILISAVVFLIDLRIVKILWNGSSKLNDVVDSIKRK